MKYDVINKYVRAVLEEDYEFGEGLTMVSKEVVARARRRIAIQDRYDKQELIRVGGRVENIRRDWTPKQLRRMEKKLKKNPRNY